MFNVQLLSGVLSTKMRDCHLKITRNSPHERIIIFVTQFKDSSHIKEYAIGIYLFSELKHADGDYNAGVEGHTSAEEQPLPMQCTSSFSSAINIANITSEHIYKSCFTKSKHVLGLVSMLL